MAAANWVLSPCGVAVVPSLPGHPGASRPVRALELQKRGYSGQRGFSGQRGRDVAPELLCPLSTGSSLSSESSPVSSPATNHSSPASTPKRVPMGPIIVPPGGHSVPSTPPVVTIAPTKTVNGVWRSESRQVSGLVQRYRHNEGRGCP